MNPLRNILTEGVDFAQVVQSPIKLFITATNVADRSRPACSGTATSRRRC